MRLFNIFLILAFVMSLASCGGGNDNSSNQTSNNQWDRMKWDQGKWK